MTVHQPLLEEIILFSRYPRPGQVKTRLIGHLGEEGAARLHASLTEQILDRALHAGRLRPAHISLWYTDGTRQEMADWLGSTVTFEPQQGADLGDRMVFALRSAWARGVERSVLIGSDCPELSAEHICQALEMLDRHDLVLGPAADGGYYLIGLRRDFPPSAMNSLFADIPWGSDRVCQLTKARAATANLRFCILKELHDLDRPEDLRYHGYHPDP